MPDRDIDSAVRYDARNVDKRTGACIVNLDTPCSDEQCDAQHIWISGSYDGGILALNYVDFLRDQSPASEPPPNGNLGA